MKENLILALLLPLCLYVGAKLLRQALSRLWDWNLRRQFFVAGSAEPTTLVDYLTQRERERVNFRKQPAYQRALERQQWQRACARALPDDPRSVGSGVR